MSRSSDIAARLDRLESLDEIRQLAAKYGLAYDMCDLDAAASLFPEDVYVEKGVRGRPALKRFLERLFRRLGATTHQIGNHIIEFDDPDHAEGIVYCKCDNDTGAHWVIVQLLYYDRYERIGGRWYFRSRMPLSWYATEFGKAPLGARKIRWPGQEPYDGSFHDLFPAWRAFQDTPGISDAPLVDEPAPGKFIAMMRRGATLPPNRDLKRALRDDQGT